VGVLVTVLTVLNLTDVMTTLFFSLAQYDNNLGNEGAAMLSSSLEQMTQLKRLNMVRFA
jgi:hypothetical protein